MSFAFSAIAIVVSVTASTTRAADVAEQVTPGVVAALVRPVTEQVIAESRTGRADTARRLLAEENARLAAVGLPVVGFPPAAAPPDEVVGAWITARVLRVLPPQVTERLARDVAAGRAPRVLPSLGPIPPDELGDGDITVTELPDEQRPAPEPQRRVQPSAPAPTAAPPARPQPSPAAPPEPRRRGLCLLGTLLC